MIYELNINTSIEIKKLDDLPKLKIFMEVNKLEKPNFSKIGRELGVDYRTVKNYYYGFKKKKTRNKGSMFDQFYDEIKKLLSPESKQHFSYKSHLFRYLAREHKMKGSRSNFNHYILKHKEFADYFKENTKTTAIKTETSFGKQAQFDWKEKISFEFSNGEKIIINVASLVLSASRFKFWGIYLTMRQDTIFDFLTKVFEKMGGVVNELVIDNAKTMMNAPRTKNSNGIVNDKFYQFSKDFNFKIKPCMASRPQTKAKVESPMKLIDEIRNYNGVLDNIEQLYLKLEELNNEANSRISQATNLPPILLFNKEKECFNKLPNNKILSYYKNKTTKVIINSNSLFKYQQKFYSVPSEYIGKKVSVEITENQLHVYFNTKLITVHDISVNNKLISYKSQHHKDMINKTFKKKENVKDYTLKHLKEMEKFNEQISKVVTEFERT